MEKAEIRPYEITSLQPGFLVVRVEQDYHPGEFRIDPKEWEALKAKGYSGGIIVFGDTRIETLDDKVMADLGWVRKQT